MSRNPVLNALAAAGYILLVAIFFSLVPPMIPEPIAPLVPILLILSLFVFSAAVMGYLIIGMPLRLFIEGEKQEAVVLFGKTLLAFAAASIILFLLALLVPPEWYPTRI